MSFSEEVIMKWEPITIPRMFEAVAFRYPEREALVQGSTRLTYGELLEQTYRFANALVELGVQPKDKVAIWLPNYPEWVVANLSIAAVGGVTVPVNTRFKASEVEYILNAADVSVLIISDRFMTNDFLARLEEIVPNYRVASGNRINSDALPELRHVITVGAPSAGTIFYDELIVQQSGAPSTEVRRRIDMATPDDPVNMFWTSGTTAKPKGALMSHTVLENIYNYSLIFGYGKDDRCLISTPLFYTTANYWAMIVALMYGACMVPLLEFTPSEALSAIDHERVTIMMGIPNMFINYLRDPDFDQYSMSSLRAIWVGGATTPPELIREIKSKMGVEILCQVYGMTETGGITSITPLNTSPELLSKTVGCVLPNYELRLVDPDTCKDVGFGEDGELWVRSPYNLLGYYGMPARQAAAFFAEGDWYRTGDVLQRDAEGLYYFRGRTKDMIKVGGENVAARDVENVLFSHPAVVQVAVVGIPDVKRNEAVIAFVETSEQVSEDELIEFCRQRLAPYKVPQSVLFESDWPTTATGKIQKFVLAARLEEKHRALS